MDPNPAVAAQKNGRFSIFFQKRILQKLLTAYISPIYQIKADEMLFPMQKESFRFDKKVCVGSALSSDISSKSWRNLEGIWGNLGEIPHTGWKIRWV